MRDRALPEVRVAPLDGATASAVCDLYRAVYGDRFPFPDVYDPQKLLGANRERRQINVVASVGGRVVGQAVTVRSAWNSRLYELVGLMVLPEARGLGLSQRLARTLVEEVFPGLDWSVRYTESTTAHVRSQKVDLSLGHRHTALALDILPPGTFGHDELLTCPGRGSCVMSFFERQPLSKEIVLPERYGPEIRALASPLGRAFGVDRGPSGPSGLEVFLFEAASTAYLAVPAPGEDFADVLEARLAELPGVASCQLQIGLAQGVSSAVEAAREQGFFFGGLLPGWFPQGDALLLQRTASEPDWPSIHLLSETARDLLERVRRDREVLP